MAILGTMDLENLWQSTPRLSVGEWEDGEPPSFKPLHCESVWENLNIQDIVSQYNDGFFTGSLKRTTANTYLDSSKTKHLFYIIECDSIFIQPTIGVKFMDDVVGGTITDDNVRSSNMWNSSTMPNGYIKVRLL